VAIERHVAADLGLSVEAWSRVSGGTQNRLFQLRTREGPPLLVKLYAVDRWPRLETEYTVLSALNRRRMARVPQALCRGDELSYAVYSFEPGATPSASELTETNVETVAAFMAELHSFGPDDIAAQLMPAVDAIVFPAAYRRMIDGRLRAADQRLTGLHAEVNRLLDQLLDRAGPPVPRTSWRLTSGDFGPQNMLFTIDGALTVVDFEAAGWDDQAHAVMGFVAHPTTEDLAPELSARFLAAYARLTALSAAERARYERVGRVLDIEWVAVFASALSSEVIANKRSAVVDFSEDAYIANVFNRIDHRLTRARGGTGYPFPP